MRHKFSVQRCGEDEPHFVTDLEDTWAARELFVTLLNELCKREMRSVLAEAMFRDLDDGQKVLWTIVLHPPACTSGETFWICRPSVMPRQLAQGEIREWVDNNWEEEIL